MEKSKVLFIGLLANEKPEVFKDLNNGQGTIHYNHNIKEVLVIVDKDGNITVTDDPEKATGTMWQYDSLRVEYPKTADNIYSTLLTAKYPANTESKLQNEYNSAVLGILPEEAKDPYIAFLNDRITLHQMVEDDFANINTAE